MDRMIWTAVTGMNASMARQRMIASNMANAQTIGFRAEVMRVTPMTLQGPSLEARAMTDAEVHGAIMTPGPITGTGRALDVAVEGDGWIAVQAPDGSEAYTKRGDLQVSVNGVVTDGAGHPVMGDGGPIALPPFEKLDVGSDGTVSLRMVGQDATSLAAVERIKLVKVDPTRL